MTEQPISSTSTQQPVFGSDKEIAETLKSLWEQQFKVVDLVIALATGSLVFLVNTLFSESMAARMAGQDAVGEAARRLSVISVGLLGSGIIVATFWRILSLTWMEIECVGSRTEANHYLTKIGVTGQAYAFQKGPTKTKRVLWIVSQYLSVLLILASWVCLLWLGMLLLRLPHRVTYQALLLISL